MSVDPIEESEKIFNLQKAYKSGEISEEDLSKEEYKELVKLYEEQNKKLEEKLEKKLEKLKKKLDRFEK